MNEPSRTLALVELKVRFTVWPVFNVSVIAESLATLLLSKIVTATVSPNPRTPAESSEDEKLIALESASDMVALPT